VPHRIIDAEGFVYTYMQVLADAVEAAKGLDQDKLADWLRGHTLKTVTTRRGSAGGLFCAVRGRRAGPSA
jgi:hypothetical protein